jgi:BirA family biotin operon repressor/biotin-[acetyl-CoA-carboxylase] ligase
VSDLAPEVVLPLLRGRLGRPYAFVAECESTQRLLGPAEPEGATVAADHQTQGRGRLGRSWLAPPGCALLFSVVLRPEPPMPRWPELSVLAGGRKIAGILPEAGDGRVVLGIGVNVNQAAGELPADAVKPPTSLRLETEREWPRAPLLAAILTELEWRYDEWQGRHAVRS